MAILKRVGLHKGIDHYQVGHMRYVDLNLCVHYDKYSHPTLFICLFES